MAASELRSLPSSASNCASGVGGITIRPMRIRDLGQICHLDRLSFSLPWPESAFRYELVDNPHSFILVAELKQPDLTTPLVGVIVVWEILDEAHIATLAVHPEHRRTGIASQLLLEALKIAITRKAVTATLEVRSKNVAAQELYHKFHFQVVGHRPRYYRDDLDDALIMTVDLRQVDAQGHSYLEMIQELARPRRGLALS
ncbi:MAG: ribosomal protein S18-alanine N-acetyltransferase [Anaerolineales bacterium]|nr:MAG: ribosomal protein S18-alanine N-acetyltransferase [Anaerolineales bacterium]